MDSLRKSLDLQDVLHNIMASCVMNFKPDTGVCGVEMGDNCVRLILDTPFSNYSVFDVFLQIVKGNLVNTNFTFDGTCLSVLDDSLYLIAFIESKL